MGLRFKGFVCAAGLLMATPGMGAFVPDEFDGPLANWTFHDSTAPGTTCTVTDGKLVMTPVPDSDLFTFVNTHGFIEQDAPAGTNWEVVVKIDGFDPTQAGQQRDFCRGGLQLWQDNDHQIVLSLLSNFDGLQVGTQTFMESAPTPAQNGHALYSTVLDIFNTGPQPSYWMKLQKTPKGYLGFYSIDGTNFINFMTIARNRETADGYFTGEKIRLFAAGGFGAGAVSPMNFDYIRSNTLPAPPAGYLDDEFNGPSLGPQWGYHPGVAQGSLGFNEGQLVMTAGPFAEVWESRDQAQLIYQDAPSSGSYSLTTKVAPTVLTQPGLTFELFSSYGLWLWRDNATWAQIMNQRGEEPAPGGGQQANNRIEVAFKRDGIFESERVSFGTGPCPEYLRLEKVGDMASVQYSFDNVNWTTVNIGANSQFFVGSGNHQVRLFNKRVFDNGAPPDSSFDWLRAGLPASSRVQDWQLF